MKQAVFYSDNDMKFAIPDGTFMVTTYQFSDEVHKPAIL